MRSSSTRSSRSSSTSRSSSGVKTINTSTLGKAKTFEVGKYGKVTERSLTTVLSGMGVRSVSIGLSDGSYANYDVGSRSFSLNRSNSRPTSRKQDGVVEIDVNDINSMNWETQGQLGGQVCQDVYIARSIAQAFSSVGNSNLSSISLVY